MNRFEELEAFVAVVDYQGFSSASEKLGVAKSMLSRRVTELERRLGVQLLQRTTRRQSLTDSGQAFYQRAIQVLADLEEAEQFVADAQCQLSGRIRLALPLGFGVSQLALPVSEFLHEHPDIKIDIDLSDRQLNLVEENIDLAIRIGELKDSNLIARRLSDVHFAICASPGYLSAHGEPQHLAELVDHEVLIYSNVEPGRQWSYSEAGESVSPRVKYRLTANNGEFLAAVACHGNAIVTGPLVFLQRHIDSGALVPILKRHTHPAVGMYAVYPPGRLISRRVKIFSDALYAHFRELVL
ncbi:MAG: LysR family transcriptional regulator [Gammaproteobacteria bacterium]|nr:LysR family transcriptional regulator [Gammaproteobacteria bacterium]